jgi:hypothetical protein
MQNLETHHLAEITARPVDKNARKQWVLAQLIRLVECFSLQLQGRDLNTSRSLPLMNSQSSHKTGAVSFHAQKTMALD